LLILFIASFEGVHSFLSTSSPEERK